MQDKPENISSSLMHSVVNDYTSGALMEFSKSVVDDLAGVVLKSDIATHIPIISGIVGLTKAALNFHDRRYISKLLSFLSETAKATEEDKEKYRKKLDENPEECRKAGEIILDLIDKITGNQKAIMIGKIFRAFMHEDAITTTNVITLSEMVEKAYLVDLTELSKKEGGRWNDSNLENVGIKKPMRVEDVNNALSVIVSRIPAIREAPPDPDERPEVLESGFTEEGDLLRRILQDY
jgi:hypothetical protein